MKVGGGFRLDPAGNSSAISAPRAAASSHTSASLTRRRRASILGEWRGSRPSRGSRSGRPWPAGRGRGPATVPRTCGRVTDHRLPLTHRCRFFSRKPPMREDSPAVGGERSLQAWGADRRGAGADDHRRCGGPREIPRVGARGPRRASQPIDGLLANTSSSDLLWEPLGSRHNGVLPKSG